MGDDLAKYDSSEITFCIERQSDYKDIYGSGKIAAHMLPWTLVRFNAAGESRDYVMPLPPQANIMGSGIHSALTNLNFSTEVERPLYYRYGRAFIEYMPNKPFPIGFGTGQGGDYGIHFFGGI